MPEELHIPYLVRCLVHGPFACFTRPEMKVERVTYDVMTPSAARGILEAIYWKPEIRWTIDRIHVINPVQLTNIRRNEVASKVAAGTVSTAMKQGSGSLALYTEDDRQQRAAIILKDVKYVIEAHFNLLSHEPDRTRNDELAKHHSITKRRLIAGQCFHQPYFGTREFPADFSWVESHQDIPPTDSSLANVDLGFMLHDIDHGEKKNPKFFRAKLIHGVLNVPPLDSSEVLS